MKEFFLNVYSSISSSKDFLYSFLSISPQFFFKIFRSYLPLYISSIFHFIFRLFLPIYISSISGILLPLYFVCLFFPLHIFLFFLDFNYILSDKKIVLKIPTQISKKSNDIKQKIL